MCPQKLSRAIYQHIFSRLTIAQFADCITCLADTNFVLVCSDYYIFGGLLILYFWIWLFLNVFHSHILLFAIFPSKCAPIGSAEQPWTATQKDHPNSLDLQRQTYVPIRFLAHNHACSTLSHKLHTTQFRLYPPVTSAEVTKHLQTPTVALKL